MNHTLRSLLAAIALFSAGALGAVLVIRMTGAPAGGRVPAGPQAGRVPAGEAEPDAAPEQGAAAGLVPPEAEPGPLAAQATAGHRLGPLPEGLGAPADQHLATGRPALRYRFQAGVPVSFECRTVMEQAETRTEAKSRITFRLSDKPVLDVLPPEFREQLEKRGDSNGTGFFIHPDGLIATCLHVVEDLEEVTVDWQERSLAGRIVYRNAELDLALVRVDVSGARFLRLATETPRLGQVARVFGFPLTDALGKTMKLTTGTVSGFDRLASGSRIQLDVTANPGNSGGPATNDSGEVIGIVDSMLSGSEIASISFAVPSAGIADALDGQSVPWSNAAAQPPAGAVTRLEDVGEAVVMIRIPARKQIGQLAVLTVSGQMTLVTTPNVRQRPVDPLQALRLAGQSSRSVADLTGTVVLDPRGKLLLQGAQKLWPGESVTPVELVMPLLPAAGETLWEQKEQFLIETREETAESLDPFMLFHRHFGGAPFGRPPDRPNPRRGSSTLIANRSERFRLIEPGPVVRLGIARDVSALAAGASEDTTASRSTGEFRFDTEAGTLLEYRSSGTVEDWSSGNLVRHEFRTDVQAVSREQLDREARAAEEARRTALEAERQREAAMAETVESFDRVRSPKLDQFRPDQ